MLTIFFFFAIDDPNPGARHTFNRPGGTGNNGPRSRIFPSISSRLPMMEGYAFITLDSNMSDIGDSQSVSILQKKKGVYKRCLN